MTFFSGQDQATLREEGNDRNCFVSLIVNNAGIYCAAVTRKIQKSTEVTTRSLGTSYEFFGEGSIKTGEDPMTEVTKAVNEEVIEYFMLDVEVEQVENPLDYLDTRFEEIEAKKKASKPIITTTNLPISKGLPAQDESFYDWIHSNRKESAETKESLYSSPVKYKEAELFDSEEIQMEDIDWRPDPTIIHHLVCQLLTCSLIVNPDIDLKQWVTRHMIKKYNELFVTSDGVEFSNWSDAYVEFLICHYSDENTPIELYEETDTLYSMVAEAMSAELDEYPSNDFIVQYQTVINKYLI